MNDLIDALQTALCAAVITLLLCAIGVWSLLFADFDGSERASCKAGSVAAIFTDCEVAE
jgi:hypothetical protein